jgi:hypothetical protein
MSRRAATQREITRAIKAAMDAGLTDYRVEVDGGKVVVLPGGSTPQRAASETEDLDRELAEFEASHGKG